MKKLSKANRAEIIEQGLDTLRLGDVVIITRQVNEATVILISGTVETEAKIAPFSMQATCPDSEDFARYLATMLCHLRIKIAQAFESNQEGMVLSEMSMED
jgi:hypothetical protein